MTKKVYVWQNIREYDDGTVIVIATSKKEAREKAYEIIMGSVERDFGGEYPWRKDIEDSVVGDLKEEPIVKNVDILLK